MIGMAEYIWLDGTKPTAQLRSKARSVCIVDDVVSPDCFERWSFDGSSTAQSFTRGSDLLLEPVFVCPDPLRGPGNYLVFCEVLDRDGQADPSNTRAPLRQQIQQSVVQAAEVWVGFEQEYVLWKEGRPLGFPAEGLPAPQGLYYCGVGAQRVFGREIIEAHVDACLEAGLNLYGINAEVLPGQWEYQLGYRPFDVVPENVLTLCDQAWIARWLLIRIAEEFDVEVSFHNKPVKGDWNGSGCHTNFSTKAMRDPATGLATIHAAIAALERHHAEHIAVYGYGLEERLTGAHETCSIHQFRAGVSDRGASIRIPELVQKNNAGYLEDRRPGANMDPYQVIARLLKTLFAV